MTDRLTDLLEEVADDGGRPLAFTTADVVGRGRAARRRRATLVAVPAAAVVAAATVVVVSLGGGDATERPAPGGPGTASATATDPSTPDADREPTGPDARAAARCERLADLGGFTLDAQVTDDAGLTATFVSDDATQWRECTVGGASVDGVTPAWPLDTGPITDEIALEGGIDFADQCGKLSGSCSERLYTGVFPLHEGVASVEVETPRGRRVDAVVGDSTYVVRFAEAGTESSVPPIVATLRDADGAVLHRYDYNDLMR